MRYAIIAFMFYCAINTSLSAIPKEFNLRENDEAMTPNIDTGEPTKVPDNNLPLPPQNTPNVIPQKPDGIMLNPTELQITPQRPKVPSRPKRPDTPPPDPLPQFQEDRKSSSPY